MGWKWDWFGLFSFTFKIADSESFVLREALKSIFIFLNHKYVPYGKETTKYTSRFFSNTLLLPIFSKALSTEKVHTYCMISDFVY